MINPQQIHQRIRSGDRKAEEELALFLTNSHRVEYLKSLGPLADDYLQELSIQVIEDIRANKVNHPDKLIAYCTRMASYKRIDGLRAAGGAARRLLTIDEGKHRQSSGNIENELILAQEIQTALKLIEQLDPLSGEIIRRYYFEEQRTHRIKRDLRLTDEEFRGRKDRAVRKLRDDYRALAQQWRTIPIRKPIGGWKAAA